MVGPASVLAILILAAAPVRITIHADPQDRPIQLTTFQDDMPLPAPGREKGEKAPLPPVPRDSADEKAPAGAATEGIPGLGPLTEEPAVIPHPPKAKKPAKIAEPAKIPEPKPADTSDLQRPPKPERMPKTEPKSEPKPAPKSQSRPEPQPAERDLPKPERSAAPARPPRFDPTEEQQLPDPPVKMPRSERPGTAVCSDETFYSDQYQYEEAKQCDGTCRRRGFCHWAEDIVTEGWLDQGFTLNTLSPRDRLNGPVTFNDRSNDYQLNQLYMLMRRDVDLEGDTWDLGGRVDLLYGTDSFYVTSRGLETFDDLSPKWNAQRYGLAMPQCYMEVFAPWGNGLSMKLGHFYSILGYETVPATENFFYSHSYLRQYVEPFTFTGLLGATRLGDFEIQAGMTRGDNNWDDNNNDLGFVGSIGWTSRNERTKIALGVDAAREQPDQSTNIHTLYSLVIQQKLAQRWEYVFQWDFAHEPGAGVGNDLVDRTNSGSYGIDNYLFYTINERWKAGARFEWFRDEGGARVPGAGRTGDYYELTAGVNWKPNRYVAVRPELRWDWTGTPELLPFGDNTRSNQLLLSCDVVVKF